MPELVETTLGEICRQQGGSIQTGPFGSQLHASDYSTSGTPVVMPVNLVDGNINEEGITRVADEHVTRLARHRLESGDIVFSRRGDVTRFALVSERETGWLCGTGCLKVSVGKPTVATPAFIASALASLDSKEWLIRHAVGATMPNLNTDILGNIPITLPPLEEQHAIAEILGELNDKINLNRLINQTLETMAQAIFKSWFVDFDPVKAKIAAKRQWHDLQPVHKYASPVCYAAELENPTGDLETYINRAAMRAIGGKTDAELDQMSREHHNQLAATAALFPDEMDESELGEIPKGWEALPLSRMVQLIGGGTPKRSEADYWNGDIPWFSVKDAPNNGDVWVVDTDEKITDLGLNRSSTKLLTVGTTIISARGTVGKLALVGRTMAMNQSCYGVLGSNGVGDFFNYFNLKEAIETLKQNTHGAVFDTITQTTFDAVCCVKPCIGTLQSFEFLIQPLLGKIKNNVVEANTLVKVRDILLPKLLSGELSVSQKTTEAVL